MASKSKLIIDSTNICKIIPTDHFIERFESKKIIVKSKHANGLQNYPFSLSDHSPQQQNIISELLAKFTLNTKNSEVLSHLYNRPKTVLNIKNNAKVKTLEKNANKKYKQYSTLEILPKCTLNALKKDVEYIGDYELDNEIGRGTYAIVKLAHHKITNEKVAIKIYEKNNLTKLSRKKSVEREIKILNKLKHPNIIKLISTYETSSSISLIFEYINGCSLIDYLKNRSAKKIEEYEAKAIFIQIIQALEFCHSLGVTHRDIKLENVLLDDKHNVKLIDFGFSTFISIEKKIKLFCGTLSYMAPEILSNKETFGPPTDIWAAGILLYIIITGTFPFKAPHTKELYSKILRGIYVIPPTLSSDVKSLFNKIFENNPCKRPTAKELLMDPWIKNTSERSCNLNIRNFSAGTPFFNKTFS